MIVPQYWAEGRIRERINGKQVTMRRFGWSDTSQADAQSNADQRAREALVRFSRGEKLERREPKLAYNGAAGVPIREEILERHGDAVITRNLYGARCLNTPNVLFADVDFALDLPTNFFWIVAGLLELGLLAFIAKAWQGWSDIFRLVLIFFVGSLVVLFLAYAFCQKIHQLYIALRGGMEKLTRTRLNSFLHANPDWHIRLYRTPAGFRLLVMHRTFQPNEPAVAEFFKALGTDSLYAKMCFNQQCFRARLTPKPWRIGISQHMRPRPGFWPVNPERLPERTAWIEDYEKKASQFAACEFLEKLGSPVTDPIARDTQRLHDEISRAMEKLKIA